MPLLLALPIIAGLTGLFLGSQVDDKLESSVVPIGGGTTQKSMPLWLNIVLVVAGLIIVLIIIKQILKKF